MLLSSLPLLLMVNGCKEEFFFKRIVYAHALAFHPTHLPHEGLNGVLG